MKLGIVALGAVLVLTACGDAQGTAQQATGNQGKKVVAATAWEGALAKAAGAGEVKVIVPASVVHAADYEPKPSDLVAVSEADVVLYAEFEGFAGKLKEAAGGDARVEAVVLDNKPDVVRSEVRKLAALLDTKQAAEEWIAKFDRKISELSVRSKGKVVSQAFVTYMAEITGLEVVGTFGPQPITPAQVADLAAKEPALVLDNAHMPTSGGVLPDTGAKQVEIVNYPGADLDLLSVYTTNADRITAALG
ncbi:metal ABC transporter substrate-binding protein [Actinokineospora diospyrosa]|uniref:Zinc transport system substrate-binding protein n=1 Tax=Actinokineospora diospyrosa TaxID=103728 RepID=A0ABT1I678_9PSEU|nr:metal ABC transporter substrate-binding protein [Actinokineospora diospyrosa]MCP2268135.1 zinc transport system substrate-binding protein [Actinokineospora diospyrosa]